LDMNRGFFNDTSPNKVFSPNNMNSPADGSSKKRNQPLLPVTIRQILNAQQITPESDDFLLNGQPLNQVSIVGQIVNVNPLATNLNYQVDDSTGTIDVRIWVDQEGMDYAHTVKDQWNQGVYVRIIGSLRSFQGKRSVVALPFILIEDFNELTHHLLEVIHLHLSFAPPTNKSLKREKFAPSISHNSITSSSYSKQPQQSIVNSNANSALNELQSEIIQLVKSSQGEEAGHAIQDIVNTYRDVKDESSVRKAIQFLMEEGYLYTTTDAEHVAITSDDY